MLIFSHVDPLLANELTFKLQNVNHKLYTGKINIMGQRGGFYLINFCYFSSDVILLITASNDVAESSIINTCRMDKQTKWNVMWGIVFLMTAGVWCERDIKRHLCLYAGLTSFFHIRNGNEGLVLMSHSLW